MDKDKTDKVEMIILTAQKRFGLYGLEKTSMQEIANDLGLSKASLYYYFPDKESLYRSVIEKEQAEFIDNISKKIIKIRDPEMVLTEYITARLIYFRKLMNLSRLKHEEYSNFRPLLRDLLDAFREKEKEILSGIFNSGIEKGIFENINPENTAELFLDLLKGLRMSLISRKNMMSLDITEFEQLHSRSLEFTRIFIKGIKQSK
ncbi:MAG TPA: TetR/AcrR family transcriptional regulator [Bacteroidales bacterium]|jgi:AcrR family transcriptional regulator|nr:TetR/AcrR family transcriptional regulator [Bacteroidales bacterium]